MIDAATTRKIARLARIGLHEGEDALYARELSGILQWIDQLNTVNTEGVQPLTSVSSVHLRWRDDVVTDGQCAKDVLANAPASAYGCFAVPKVIE